MRNVLTIFRRELAAYFATPLAYVFIVIFLVMAGILTFFVGNFFERGQADLQPFFTFHPWLYVVLIPALSMRLWAEERRSGTIELFLTLPIRMTEAVAGKFLAAWCFAGIALIGVGIVATRRDAMPAPVQEEDIRNQLGALTRWRPLRLGRVSNGVCFRLKLPDDTNR